MNNDNQEDNTDKQRIDLMQQLASKLGEHFANVQILASQTENGETTAYYAGIGDWFARQGLAQEFVSKNNAVIVAKEIVDRME